MTKPRSPRSRERGPDRRPRKLRLPPSVASADATAADATYVTSCAAKERAEARYRKIRADCAAIELKRLRGELISREEVDQQNVSRIVILRNALLAMPRQICPKLEGLEVRQMIGVMQARVEELLDDFVASDP